MPTRAVSPKLRCLFALVAVAWSLAGAQQSPEVEALLSKVQQRLGPVEGVRGFRTSFLNEVTSKGTTLLVQTDEVFLSPDRHYFEWHSVDGEGYNLWSPAGAYWVANGKLTDYPSANTRQHLDWFQLNSIAVIPHRRDGQYSFALLGSDVVAGTPVRLLRITYHDLWVTWYIDANEGRILRKVLSNGSIDEFTDYRMVDGVAWPFHIVRTTKDGVIYRIQIQEVEWNPPADDGLFEKPRRISLKNVPFHPGAVTTATLARTGTVRVESQPHGAQLYLDDVPKGVTSEGEGRLVLEGVTPGSHRVRLTAAGFKEWSKTVALEPGDTLSVDATLERSGPPPFSASDVEQMLRGGVSPKRAAVLVKERGVDFGMDDATEQRLRAAGADGDLLLAIAKAKK